MIGEALEVASSTTRVVDGLSGWLWMIAVAVLVSGCTDREPAEPGPPAIASIESIAPVARVETTDTWLDLIAQRPNAVATHAGAMVIDLGIASARKHVALAARHQWQLARTVDDRPTGLVLGHNGTLDLPIDGDLAVALVAGQKEAEESPLAISIDVRPLVDGQVMTVLWNERPLANLPLEPGWQRRTLSLPVDATKAGENRLRLYLGRVGAWEDVEDASVAVGRIEVATLERIRRPPTPSPPMYRVQPKPGGERALELSGATGLAYYLVPPARGRLRLEVQGRGRLTVHVSTDEHHCEGRATDVVFDEDLSSTTRRIDVDLSAWGREPIRLELRLHGANAVARFDTATVVARRTVPVDERKRAIRDVVVVAVEGLRADALDRSRRPELPVLDTFMAEALVFDRAYALSPAAVPSHASWMTSVTPPVHLTVRGTFVANGQVGLGEALSRFGYFRSLATANDDVNRERGLHQGVDAARILGESVDDDSAGAVVRALFDSAEEHDEHWLLTAIVNDPQAPYEPPRDHLRDVRVPEGAPLPHLTHIWVGRVRLGKRVPSPEELDYVSRLYRGELQVVDAALQDVIEHLQAENRYDDAIVVVMGAHGEEFFEHDGAGHGRTLYEESLRVPLMIRAPGLLTPGRVEEPVDLLDLAPTLLDLLGVDPPRQWQGESLVPIIDDPVPPPRLMVGFLGDGSRSAVIGDAKYMLGPGRLEAYYDLEDDPKESRSRIDEGGIGLRMVRSALAWQIALESRWRRVRWGTGANLRSAFALDLGM